MRWSRFLASQSQEDARALVDDLRLGYSTLTMMMRQLVNDGELLAVVSAHGPVELALGRAYRRLPPVPKRRAAVAPPAVLPAHKVVLAPMDPRSGDGARLLAQLQSAAAEAGASSKAIGADGSTKEISKHLCAALNEVEQLRAELTSQV
jgi:hypothetical protein